MTGVDTGEESATDRREHAPRLARAGGLAAPRSRLGSRRRAHPPRLVLASPAEHGPPEVEFHRIGADRSIGRRSVCSTVSRSEESLPRVTCSCSNRELRNRLHDGVGVEHGTIQVEQEGFAEPAIHAWRWLAGMS